jgi:hypothetical protein
MLRKLVYWLQSRCTRCGNSATYDAVESMEGICGWNKHCPRCREIWFVMPRRALALKDSQREGGK